MRETLHSVAILAQAISCSNVHGVFPVHERFWFCFVQVSTNQFSLFAAFASVFMATGRASDDALHTSLLGSPPLSSNVGSPHGSGHDLDGMGTRSEVLWTRNSMPFSQTLYTSKRRLLKFLLSRHGCPVWIYISRKRLKISRVDLQRRNRIPVSSLHLCANSRHMLPQHQMFPVRQDPGLHSNTLTAPQPHGPMAQCHVMTLETHDEGLILSQAQKMNNHEVPS